MGRRAQARREKPKKPFSQSQAWAACVQPSSQRRCCQEMIFLCSEIFRGIFLFFYSEIGKNLKNLTEIVLYLVRSTTG